ncbi:MAG: hypothetical protein DRO13_05380, partial [Thermoprotei archaeon]
RLIKALLKPPSTNRYRAPTTLIIGVLESIIRYCFGVLLLDISGNALYAKQSYTFSLARNRSYGW